MSLDSAAAVFLACSYLLGSINFSVILFRRLGLDDPRGRFSGNPGTTNVYRIAGPWWAALVLTLDIGRAGIVAILSMKILPAPLIPLAGFFLVLGNRYPCFHGFRGGKGVANYMGFCVFIIPLWGVASILLWPLVYRLLKITFIPSFVTIALMGIGISGHFQYDLIPTASVIATVLLIFLGHKNNISNFFSDKSI